MSTSLWELEVQGALRERARNARCPREPEQGGLGYGARVNTWKQALQEGQSKGIKGLSKVRDKSELEGERAFLCKPKL